MLVGYRAIRPDVGGQEQRKSGQLGLVRQDRQTTDRVFLTIRTKSGHRTESRQTEYGQTDTGQDFPESPDKNETRTVSNPILILNKTSFILDGSKLKELMPVFLSRSRYFSTI